MSAKGDILSRGHIVPGQYMSWDIMSRDKMSPDQIVLLQKVKNIKALQSEHPKGLSARVSDT